ncbi:hypothetical protein Fcan01_27738 [Folsomia candida]|uniref:Uncharacterized protein n=1 Tax=Folsomia candida TaxID=158441 RepID=A0A226CVW7_FOLCA|nr:hypothetical protein Fcan01_27738 [Folsomia candida]
MEAAPPLGWNITPFEYFESRWWEAAMTVFFKMPLLLDGGGNGVPCDENWIPLGTRLCPSIRKAVDVIIRYDELVDIFHDIHSNEPMNEIHVAARYGGIEAVRDYAWACAGSVDEVATCNCIAGERSHEWGIRAPHTPHVIPPHLIPHIACPHNSYPHISCPPHVIPSHCIPSHVIPHTCHSPQFMPPIHHDKCEISCITSY